MNCGNLFCDITLQGLVLRDIDMFNTGLTISISNGLLIGFSLGVWHLLFVAETASARIVAIRKIHIAQVNNIINGINIKGNLNNVINVVYE